MSGPRNDPARQFAAAWEAASDAVGEWAQRVADATNEAMDKLDPAVRAALEAGPAALDARFDTISRHFRHGQSHPDDMGVCDHRAVMTRRLGNVDVPLCAPCAAAQGFAEMAR